MDIAAGAFNSFALKADGSLVAWGSNIWGQSNVPTGNNFIDVVSGYGHGLALRLGRLCGETQEMTFSFLSRRVSRARRPV